MSTPKLRFKEFDGDWKKVELKDCIKSIDSGWSPQCESYPSMQTEWGVLKTTSVNWDGFQESANKKLPDNFQPRLEIEVKPNDILVTRAGPTERVGVVSVVPLNVREKLLISDKLIRLKNNDQSNPLFLGISLSSIKCQNQLQSKTSGLAKSQTNISQKILLEVSLKVPSKEEQTKIACFLSAVDQKISQLSQKHELLSQYKQGMMQKLFSQQIRFKADDGSEFGEWQNKTLGEVGENIIGLTYSPSDVTNDGAGILVLRSSNIKNGRLDKSDQVRVNKKIKEKIIVQPNDILICARNGSQRLIGKSVLINDSEIMTFGAFMSVYRSKYNRFISYLMQTPWFFEQVQMNLGARINQITTGTLNEFTFDFPCLEEQTKIANFLSAIDQKIQVVAQRIEQAKTWKKGLLQQMFV